MKTTTLEFIEAVSNPENDSARISFRFKESPKHFIVIKLFDRGSGQQEVWTFKIWQGDYDKVKQHWNTQDKYVLTDNDIEQVTKTLVKGFDLVKGMALA
jgi:hypothetical protein